eukprot:8640710-Alexandrium_andersonii.AAC.1
MGDMRGQISTWARKQSHKQADADAQTCSRAKMDAGNLVETQGKATWHGDMSMRGRRAHTHTH